MLLVGRKLRTRLNMILTSSTTNVVRKQQENKFPVESRVFEVGDTVLARNYSDSDKWISGSVVTVLGARHYLIDVGHGVVWKRHIDQLLRSSLHVHVVPGNTVPG